MSSTGGSSTRGTKTKDGSQEYRKFSDDLMDEEKKIKTRKDRLTQPGGARKLIDEIRQKRRSRS